MAISECHSERGDGYAKVHLEKISEKVPRGGEIHLPLPPTLNEALILWDCVSSVSLIPRPSHRPVFDRLQFLHTASDQKLDGGKAWK